MSRMYSVQAKLKSLRPGLEAKGYCLAELDTAEELAQDYAEMLPALWGARSNYWFTGGNLGRSVATLFLCSGVVTCGLAAAGTVAGFAFFPSAEEAWDDIQEEAKELLDELETAIDNICGCLSRSFPED